MRKKTLSIILDVFIGLLVITIIMLIMMIGKRGAAPMQAQEQKEEPLVPVVTAEQGTVAVTEAPTEAAAAEPAELAESPQAAMEIAMIPAKVNAASFFFIILPPSYSLDLSMPIRDHPEIKARFIEYDIKFSRFRPYGLVYLCCTVAGHKSSCLDLFKLRHLFLTDILRIRTSRMEGTARRCV